MSDAILYTNTASTHLSASWLGSQTLRSVVPSDTEDVWAMGLRVRNGVV